MHHQSFVDSPKLKRMETNNICCRAVNPSAKKKIIILEVCIRSFDQTWSRLLLGVSTCLPWILLLKFSYWKMAANIGNKFRATNSTIMKCTWILKNSSVTKYSDRNTGQKSPTHEPNLSPFSRTRLITDSFVLQNMCYHLTWTFLSATIELSITQRAL